MKKLLFIIIGFLFITSCKTTTKEEVQDKETTTTKIIKTVPQKPSPTQSLIDSFSQKNHDVGVVLLTQIKGKTATYTAGFANLETKKKTTTKDLFEIGSASKLFTAISIMQLIEKGEFSLETTLDTFYPSGDIQKLANIKGENYWNNVTVEMLLNHTTGFIDYLNVYGSDAKTLEVFNNSKKEYKFNDIITLAINHGDANFIPGSEFKYSNTNYTILGDIISKVSKTPWRTYIENNIFKVADLQNTVFGSKMSADQKEQLITGYYNDKTSQMPYTLAGSAGAIVSNASDLQKFLNFWAEGKFFTSPEMVKKQITTGVQNMYPGSDMITYAMGIMSVKGTEAVGHAGQTFGFQSYLAINPTTKDTHVVLLNNAGASSITLFMNVVSEENKNK